MDRWVVVVVDETERVEVENLRQKKRQDLLFARSALVV